LRAPKSGEVGTPAEQERHESLFMELPDRSRRPELMDEPDLDEARHVRALEGLGRINRLSRSASILWPTIAAAARRRPGACIRVLDVATGGGDVPIGLALRAHRAGLQVSVAGCDVSPAAVAFAARSAESAGIALRFFPLDALNDPLPEGFDFVTCSLFLHHLSEADGVKLLRRMAVAAREAVLVNDLARSRVGYLLAWVGCRLLSRSPIVHHDGPVSVRSAFTPEEAIRLAELAGLAGVRLSRHWPQRFLLHWSRREHD
jgi:SAM-dependent methyltransferase